MSGSNLAGALLQSLVSVDGMPASRQVVAVERQPDGVWRVCGTGQSDADGQAQVSIQAQTTSLIYAIAVDDWGRPWSSGMVVALGDTVRPSQFSGWMYRVTQAGQLPAHEPDWWTGSTVGPLPVGTALLEAVRYYQPIAHGPISLDFEGIRDQYWGNVASLLYFDGVNGSTSFVDEKGISWSAFGGASISSDRSVFGGASCKFDGNNDWLVATSPMFAFGTGDFSIEFRVCKVGETVIGSSAASIVVDMRTAEPSNQISIDIGPAGEVRLYVGGSYRIQSPAGAASGKFCAVEISRASGVTRMFVDGLLSGAWVDNTNYTAQTMYLGGRFAAVSGDRRSLNGNIDEFRVTSGVPRNVSNYDVGEARFPNS